MKINFLNKAAFVFGLALLAAWNAPAEEKCTACHQEEQRFSPFHDPRQIGCVVCHGGNGASNIETIAHQKMEAYPGRIASAASSCGQSNCHPKLIPLAENSIMQTLNGMIEVTREAFQEEKPLDRHLSAEQRLSETGADSYLRKLCVSCHLGSERQNHQQTLRDRGGGCSACHLETFKFEKNQTGIKSKADPGSSSVIRDKVHPRLTVRIHNDRCFGCHSRSSRISLNYVGLAEVEEMDLTQHSDFGYLPDRRLVEKQKADLHSLAGMACIDCHTVSGLMGTGVPVTRHRQQLDIQCSDCHQTVLQKKPAGTLTMREAIYPALYPAQYYVSKQGEVVVTEKQKTPLFHIQEDGELRVLQKKLNGEKIEIPPMRQSGHHSLKGHERLSCDSCHAAWAPQCYGCHISYEAKGMQWDHLKRKKTPGRWVEKRWRLENKLPALGVTKNNKIAPFVPGMNMILEKNPGAVPVVQVRYSQISPHTTQKKGRSCQSCHQNDAALGIIGEWAVSPQNPSWQVPVGWIEKGADFPGKAVQNGARSLNQEEIQRISRVGACLQCHLPQDPVYQDFEKALPYLHKQQTNSK
ncbi:MAG: hypothetical protein HQM13_13635 [SAR324 cluster bacterium]|nr:hypothetical protein [SAR324 cluster bacterium]